MEHDNALPEPSVERPRQGLLKFRQRGTINSSTLPETSVDVARR